MVLISGGWTGCRARNPQQRVWIPYSGSTTAHFDIGAKNKNVLYLLPLPGLGGHRTDRLFGDPLSPGKPGISAEMTATAAIVAYGGGATTSVVTVRGLKIPSFTTVGSNLRFQPISGFISNQKRSSTGGPWAFGKDVLEYARYAMQLRMHCCH
jgi:hypothetical protein